MPHKEELVRLSHLLLGNPFEGDESKRRRALSRWVDLPAAETSRALAQTDRIRDASSLTLAHAYAQALGGGASASVLADKGWHAHPALRYFPKGRESALRLALAAARCESALRALWGTSSAMQDLRAEAWRTCFGRSLGHAVRLERVIRDHDILIVGETGSGKEGVAAAILDGIPGDARGGPAPRGVVNVAALPETLVEGEMFGHIKGAYTGATEKRVGRIRAADGGGFFLDEVGDLSAGSQSKLLRVVETDEVMPLGSDVVHQVDVRFIAATHQDLPRMIAAGQFRKDLYERLAGCVIHVPALRERPEDIAPIGKRFVDECLQGLDMEDVRHQLQTWLDSQEARARPWTGNVRELHNTLRSMILGMRGRWDAPLTPALSQELELPSRVVDASASWQEVQDWYLRRVLRKAGQNHAQAARVLGVDRATVRRRSRAMAQTTGMSG